MTKDKNDNVHDSFVNATLLLTNNFKGLDFTDDEISGIIKTKKYDDIHGRYINMKRFVRLLKDVKRYNSHADKWGYEKLSVEKNFLTVIGGCESKHIYICATLWQWFKIGFRDGYMRSLYDDILKNNLLFLRGRTFLEKLRIKKYPYAEME